MSNTYKRIIRDGIWDNNVTFAQRLALCPLLAVTSSATNGLGMGLATTFVMALSGMMVSLLRKFITPEVRIPVFVLIMSTLVTLVEMSMDAWFHDLYKVLGLFVALIVTNCALFGRAEAFAFKNPVLPSILDGVMMGLGFTLGLVILGAVREILGSGTLFANASLLLGDTFSFLELTLIPEYRGFLLMLLPTGGFLAMGFLLAGKRIIDERVRKARLAATVTLIPPSGGESISV